MMPVEGKVVLAVVEDMFFSAKIEAVARALGIDLVEVRDSDTLEKALGRQAPRLIVLDLNCRMLRPIETIRRIREDSRLQETPLIAFFSHVQVELEREAREAGCENVIPRSRFSANLRQILLQGADPAVAREDPAPSGH